MRRILFAIIVILLIYSLIELPSFLGLLLLKKIRHIEYNPILTSSLSQDHQNSLQNLIDGKTTYLIHSPVLGWTIKPNGFWQDLYRSNDRGLRGDREYQVMPSNNSIRISSFGDSYTHCDDVKNEETWQVQLQNADHRLEVLNFGVGGYGLDQAFLRYREEGILYNSHIILIGFMRVSIDRSVNVFRPFYYPGIPLTKPRYFIRENELILLNNPLSTLNDCSVLLHNPKALLPKFGENDYYYKLLPKAHFLDFSPSVRLFKLLYYKVYNRYLGNSGRTIYKNGSYNQNSEAFKICTKLFDEFYYLVQKNKSLPIIILFPSQSDIEQYHKNRIKSYSSLIHYFDSRGYRYIDLLDVFERYGVSSHSDDLFGKFDHHSPLGNLNVAKAILDYLKENNFTDLRVIKSQIEKNLRLDTN
jgi:hypothetical protein